MKFKINVLIKSGNNNIKKQKNKQSLFSLIKIYKLFFLFIKL